MFTHIHLIANAGESQLIDIPRRNLLPNEYILINSYLHSSNKLVEQSVIGLILCIRNTFLIFNYLNYVFINFH